MILVLPLFTDGGDYYNTVRFLPTLLVMLIERWCCLLLCISTNGGGHINANLVPSMSQAIQLYQIFYVTSVVVIMFLSAVVVVPI